MDKRLEELTAYNIVNSQRRLSLLNARPRMVPFQNTATPTAAGTTETAIITIGEKPWVWNQLQIGEITASGNALPGSLYLQFNIYDADNLGLFGGVSPRGSTVLGSGVAIPYAIQPVKVFPPRTRLKLEWTNRNSIALGFELFFLGIEILDLSVAQVKDTDEMKEALQELLDERGVRN